MIKKMLAKEELQQEEQHEEKEEQLEEYKNIKFDFIKSEYDYFIENCMLSELEEKILKARIKNKSYQEMAFDFDVSVDTIKYHIKKIKKKIFKVIKYK